MSVTSVRNNNSPSRLGVVIAQISEQVHLGEIERIMRTRRGADLIVFPEGTLRLTDLSVVRTLKAWAHKYETAIVIGIIHKRIASDAPAKTKGFSIFFKLFISHKITIGACYIVVKTKEQVNKIGGVDAKLFCVIRAIFRLGI